MNPTDKGHLVSRNGAWDLGRPDDVGLPWNNADFTSPVVAESGSRSTQLQTFLNAFAQALPTIGGSTMGLFSSFRWETDG